MIGDNTRVRPLDGIRGVAILLVVLAHVSALVQWRPLQAASNGLGDLGVFTFFALSGYLITSLLISEERSEGTVNLKRFYLKRTFRILPPAYLYIAFILLCSFVLAIELTPVSVWASAGYFSNYYRWDKIAHSLRHLWSLSVEEQFYFLWPFIFVFFPRRRIWLLFLVIVLSPLWRLLIFEHPQWGLVETIDRRFDALSDTLAAGCLIAFIPQLAKSDARWNWVLNVPTGLLFIGTAGIALSNHPHIFYGAARTVVSLCLAGLIFRSVQGFPRPLAAVLSSKPLTWLGRISYSLYLWQQFFLTDESYRVTGNPVLALGLCLLAGAASYYFVERTANRLRNRVLARFPHKLSAPGIGAAG